MNPRSLVVASVLTAALLATARPASADDDKSEMQQMRLQNAMDRRSKVAAALSNMMKKMSDTDNSIIKNMK